MRYSFAFILNLTLAVISHKADQLWIRGSSQLPWFMQRVSFTISWILSKFAVVTMLTLENVIFPPDLFVFCTERSVRLNLCAGFLIQRWPTDINWLAGWQQRQPDCNGQLKRSSQRGRWHSVIWVIYPSFSGCYPPAHLRPLLAHSRLHRVFGSLRHHGPPHQRPHPWLCRFVTVPLAF